MKCRRRPVNIYQDRRRPKWQRYTVYATSIIILAFIAWSILRDTTPVRIKPPTDSDLEQLPGATVGADKIDDVYWRVKMRHVNDMLAQECETGNYSLYTNKNIELDADIMKESYIYICGHGPIINARAVISGQADESVRCRETYGTKTLIKTRAFPFSLKYISGFTFMQETKVIRSAVDACKWLHAIEIVESRWD